MWVGGLAHNHWGYQSADGSHAWCYLDNAGEDACDWCHVWQTRKVWWWWFCSFEDLQYFTRCERRACKVQQSIARARQCCSLDAPSEHVCARFELLRWEQSRATKKELETIIKHLKSHVSHIHTHYSIHMVLVKCFMQQSDNGFAIIQKEQFNIQPQSYRRKSA